MGMEGEAQPEYGKLKAQGPDCCNRKVITFVVYDEEGEPSVANTRAATFAASINRSKTPETKQAAIDKAKVEAEDTIVVPIHLERRYTVGTTILYYDDKSILGLYKDVNSSVLDIGEYTGEDESPGEDEAEDNSVLDLQVHTLDNRTFRKESITSLTVVTKEQLAAFARYDNAKATLESCLRYATLRKEIAHDLDRISELDLEVERMRVFMKVLHQGMHVVVTLIEDSRKPGEYHVYSVEGIHDKGTVPARKLQERRRSPGTNPEHSGPVPNRGRGRLQVEQNGHSRLCGYPHRGGAHTTLGEVYDRDKRRRNQRSTGPLASEG